MKRAKRLYLLLGILAAACVVTLIVSMREDEKEKIKNSDEVILEINGDDVTKLSWEYGGQSLAFHKDEEWLYDEDEEFPADEEKIGELLGIFEEFGVSFEIEEVEDFGQYGLDDPECTITIETEEESYEILLGDFSTMDNERYVSIGDGNVYLVTEDPMESFEVELKDMIKDDEVPEFEEIEAISFSGSTSLEVVYEEDGTSYCEDDVYFASEEDELLPLDTTLVEEYLDTLSSLDQTTYVTYKASEEDLEMYHLASPEFSVEVAYVEKAEDAEDEEEGEEKTFTLHVGCDEEEKEEEEYSAYVRVGDSGIIYQISGEDYEAITDASYNSLRHKEVVTADMADVSEIEVTLEDTSYTISVEEEKDELICSYQDKEIESDDFTNALQALAADSFIDEEPSENQEIALKLTFADEKYPEQEIEIYRYDGEYCLVVIDGESVSLVERSAVVDLIEAVNAIVL